MAAAPQTAHGRVKQFYSTLTQSESSIAGLGLLVGKRFEISVTRIPQYLQHTRGSTLLKEDIIVEDGEVSCGRGGEELTVLCTNAVSFYVGLVVPSLAQILGLLLGTLKVVKAVFHDVPRCVK
ncbi:hypothetical protein GALMADRAFT_226427 [Galerina marginata CBS 339.88]|uniref:Uncharacterized protein n=1 Tax=Galerina marginata (strain CBS 339.88) TaxID=685588 RepID=A0A067SXU7_GALM3|nr:hypothetical protein GALMADRAFT_226427 [Galerina marginata CBS 339.88]